MWQSCEGNSAISYNASKSSCSFQWKFDSHFPQRAKQDIIYIDATGSVVLGDKVTKGATPMKPKVWKPALTVASYLTTSHNSPSISYFINSFCHAESLLYRAEMRGLWNFSVRVQSWSAKIESDPVMICKILKIIGPIQSWSAQVKPCILFCLMRKNRHRFLAFAKFNMAMFILLWKAKALLFGEPRD